MSRVRDCARGRPAGRAGDRGIDDHASTTSIPGQGRGRRGCGQGIFVKSSLSSRHKEFIGGPPPI